MLERPSARAALQLMYDGPAEVAGTAVDDVPDVVLGHCGGWFLSPYTTKSTAMTTTVAITPVKSPSLC